MRRKECKIKVLTADELLDMPEPKPKRRYGRWHVSNQRGCWLNYFDPSRGCMYSIDVNSCRNSTAACLDWIFQVSKKRWIRPEDRSDLLLAIEDLVRPQRTLCSFGIDRSSRVPGPA